MQKFIVEPEPFPTLRLAAANTPFRQSIETAFLPLKVLLQVVVNEIPCQDEITKLLNED